MRARWLIAAVLVLVGLPAGRAQAQTITGITPVRQGGTLTTTTCAAVAVPFDARPVGAQTGCVIVPLGGFSAVSVQIAGSGTAFQAEFEFTVNGVDWDPIRLTPADGSSGVALATGDGSWLGSVVGRAFRVRVSNAPDSGSVPVTVTATMGGGVSGGGGGGGGGGTVAISQTGDENGVDVLSSALPSGAATAANQTAANTALAALLTEATFDTAFTPAALADNTANPTVPKVGAFLMCFDGTTWDRCAPDPAHDDADTGNPVKIGGRAVTSTSADTPVANDDRVDATFDADGAFITRGQAPLADRVVATPVGITDGSSTSVVAAQGAGIRFCATAVTIANSSSTGVTVNLRDGTAGGVLWTFPAAADFGGATLAFPTPLCTSADTALAADPSAAASTVTVSVIGFKTKL